MVRFLRRCRRIDDLAVMEASQMVGVRTRAMTVALAAASTSATVEAEGEVMSAKRRREEGADSRLGASEMQMSLRNRSLVITQWLSRSTRNSRRKRRECVEQERMSRCSSISSCDALEEHEHIRLPSSRTDETPCKDIVSSMCNENCSQDRSEMSWPCSAQVSCPIELESTVGRQLLQSTPQSSMPCLSEIEEFFAAMENAEKKRFAMRYNFDIDEDVPLEGRYEWVRINKK